jgi:hypothetical protein
LPREKTSDDERQKHREVIGKLVVHAPRPCVSGKSALNATEQPTLDLGFQDAVLRRQILVPQQDFLVEAFWARGFKKGARA